MGKPKILPPNQILLYQRLTMLYNYLIVKLMYIKDELIMLGILKLQICNELFIVMVVSMAFSSHHFSLNKNHHKKWYSS